MFSKFQRILNVLQKPKFFEKAGCLEVFISHNHSKAELILGELLVFKKTETVAKRGVTFSLAMRKLSEIYFIFLQHLKYLTIKYFYELRNHQLF